MDGCGGTWLDHGSLLRHPRVADAPARGLPVHNDRRNAASDEHHSPNSPGAYCAAANNSVAANKAHLVFVVIIALLLAKDVGAIAVLDAIVAHVVAAPVAPIGLDIGPAAFRADPVTHVSTSAFPLPPTIRRWR